MQEAFVAPTPLPWYWLTVLPSLLAACTLPATVVEDSSHNLVYHDVVMVMYAVRINCRFLVVRDNAKAGNSAK